MFKFLERLFHRPKRMTAAEWANTFVNPNPPPMPPKKQCVYFYRVREVSHGLAPTVLDVAFQNGAQQDIHNYWTGIRVMTRIEKGGVRYTFEQSQADKDGFKLDKCPVLLKELLDKGYRVKWWNLAEGKQCV